MTLLGHGLTHSPPEEVILERDNCHRTARYTSTIALKHVFITYDTGLSCEQALRACRC